ncbi:MAG: ABC transporter ATP-binding protein [Xanthobacteraceae bacterium]|nr:ABC transporter ATP-binding protein [Xanthobacteraceae bacterium]
MSASANPAPPLVALSGVAKQFANGTLALDGVELAIARGEFVSLLGPSGCGKSTALRLIAGLGAPTRGTIAWAGDRPGARRNGLEIGFVFQDPTLMPWTTVARNVALPLELAGVPHDARDERIAAALEQVGLTGFRDAFPRELSGGMKMRVSIARGLVTDPPLLLMDEPFAALDEITRFKLNDDLVALWRTLRNTVVFVTHSVFESVYLSSRIVVMSPRPGRVFTELAIDAPFPRDEGFRTSAEYARWCRTVSQALAEAMAQCPTGGRP